MDPVLSGLFARLAEIAATKTAASVYDRISAAKIKKKDEETIAILTEMINELIEQREELISIAQGLREHLVAQQMSDEEIKHVVETIGPILRTFGKLSDDKEVVDMILSLASQDMLKTLQTLGFNYREAIGQPLTRVVSSHIDSFQKSELEQKSAAQTKKKPRS